MSVASQINEKHQNTLHKFFFYLASTKNIHYKLCITIDSGEAVIVLSLFTALVSQSSVNINAPHKMQLVQNKLKMRDNWLILHHRSVPSSDSFQLAPMD